MLKYVDNYSSAFGEGEDFGNYLALHFSVPNVDDVVITTEVVNGTHGPVTLDDDGLVISRIADKNSQTIKVVASKDGYESVTKIYTLSDLICESNRVEVIEETVLTLNEETTNLKGETIYVGDGAIAYIEELPAQGDIYIFIWNGVEYKCEANIRHMDDDPDQDLVAYFGDLSISGIDVDGEYIGSDAPFSALIALDNNDPVEYGVHVSVRESGEYTVSALMIEYEE